MNQARIEHLIVLMLENRAFDHMLGYLEYPAGTGFEGIRGKEAQYGNPMPDGSTANPGPNASYDIDPGPSHSHDAVMHQLLGNNPRTRPYQITNKGFAADYEVVSPGHGAEALHCFQPGQLPVLATLAQNFAVCDHWFCSVPGATWPNRNFAHSATSDGEVNIVMREYHNKTVFEQLSEANRDWAVYYEGFPAETMAFVNTWDPQGQNWLQRFKPIQNLYRAIQYDRLPHYAFVEPDMLGRETNSQHPSMGGEVNFKAGEQFIWRLYNTLRANMPVFEKTLLLISYDEHGGFFDHFAPPQGPEWSVPQVYHEPNSDYTFSFDLLGLRVPAVLVSPWIAPGTVDHTIYDHASIPATARKIARIDLPPLTPRDARANTFDGVLNLDAPRTDLPDIQEPFVDETKRRPFEMVELQESMVYILRDLIWTRMSTDPEKYTREAAHHRGLKMVNQILLPNLIHQTIMNDIAPNLSPKAQEKLAGFHPVQAVEGLEENTRGEFHKLFPQHPEDAGMHLALAAIHDRISRFLEDQELVDEAMRFADLVLRRLFEGHHILLRTVAGASLQDPDQPAIQAALAELYASPDPEDAPHSEDAKHPEGCIWLADYLDRWLVIRSDGRIVFNDQQPAGDYLLENASRDTAFQLIQLFTQGKIDQLRASLPKQAELTL